MKTLADINFKDKKAVIRVDFNVPLDDNFKVTDTTRIEPRAPTSGRPTVKLVRTLFVLTSHGLTVGAFSP